MKPARVTVFAFAIMMLVQVLANGVSPIEESNEPVELETIEPVMEVTSPGHVVFVQYITSDNCGFCYQYGSPAHKLLKNNHADDYVYISYHSQDFGNTADAESGNINPILGVSHLGETGGAPKSGFGDSLPLEVGCGSNTCWDTAFSSGGNMPNNVNDFSMRVTQSDNGDGTSDVIISSKYVGSGTAPSNLKLYAAVTEEVCNSHAYSDGSKGGNCWEAWLLNGGAYASNSGNVGQGSGFESITLNGNQWTNYTWTVPNNLVNGGASNMNTIAALFGGWSTSAANENVYHATDSTMGPLVDIAVDSITVSNDGGFDGYINGDQLTVNAVVKNAGDEIYNQGGQIALYQVNGAQETQIGSASTLNSLVPGATQSIQANVDSTSFVANAYDAKFRVRLSSLVADKTSSNNVATGTIAHDMVPVANSPTVIGDPSIDRNSVAQVEVKAQSMDSVDNMSTMTPTLEFSPNGQDAWSSNGITGGNILLGAAAGNPRYEFFVSPDDTMASGMYDLRVKFTDARGQNSTWVENSGSNGNGAFELMNAKPIITVDPIPTVKVDVETPVSLFGHVSDAETAMEDLTITSTSAGFVNWTAETGIMLVHFNKIQTDASGNPTQSGIYLTVTDEEGDSTGGSLLFNVIENGMPRWDALTPVTMNEGSATTVFLKNSLTDSNPDGTATAGVDHLQVAIVANDNTDLLSASVNGFNLAITAVDDDLTGVANLTLRASDGIQFSETLIRVNVENVNDAPVLNISALEGMTLFKGEQRIVDLRSHLSDADADQDVTDLYVNVISSPQISALYSMQSGIMTLQWEEPGTHEVTITIVDSEDESSVYTFSVEVISHLPLDVSKEDTNAHVFLVASEANIGRTPTYMMSLGEDIGLTNIKTTWQICNFETGLCYDIKEMEHPNTDSSTGWNFALTFDRIVSNGGLVYGDQLKLVDLTGQDSNGVNRAMESGHIYWNVTEHPAFDQMSDEEITNFVSDIETEIAELEVEIRALPEGSSSRENKQAQLNQAQIQYALVCDSPNVVCANDAASSTDTSTESSSNDLLVYIGGGVFAVIIVMLLSMLVMGRNVNEPEFKDFSNMLPAQDTVANSMYGGAAPIFQQQVTPPAGVQPGAPPVPASGLPEGWTMEQWHYYGHQYLQQMGLE